jgi:hypothetical protein
MAGRKNYVVFYLAIQDEELKKDKPKVRGRKGCYNITIGKGRYRKGEFIPVR